MSIHISPKNAILFFNQNDRLRHNDRAQAKIISELKEIDLPQMQGLRQTCARERGTWPTA
jgi:hypothetical protein